MRAPIRAAVAAAAAVATLVLANAALALDHPPLSVRSTPSTLGARATTTIVVDAQRSTDPIAAVTIYSGSGYQVNTSQAANTTIGSVTAGAFSRDQGINLPLGGSVVTADPASFAAQSAQCAGTAASQAVWIMNLSVLGQTLPIPIYVNPTAGAEQALGATKLSICLPPPDVPAGTPGRSFEGAQLTDATLTLKAGVFTTPSAGGLVRWESLFTPYNPGQGTPNLAGTFEARAFVPLPAALSLHVKYVKRSNAWRLSGKVTEGGLPAAATTVHIARGTSKSRLTKRATTRTNAQGSWRTAGHLQPRKTTWFRVAASARGTDYTALGCQNPLLAVAPAGCVSATLAQWSGQSAIVRLKP